MKSRTFLLLSLIFSLLQGPFLPAVFAEGILFSLFVPSHSGRRFLPFLFLSGVIFDLFQGRALGVTSLLFISTGTFLSLEKEQVSFNRPLFIGSLAFILNIIRGKLIFGIIPWPEASLAGLIAVLIYIFVSGPIEGKLKIRTV